MDVACVDKGAPFRGVRRTVRIPNERRLDAAGHRKRNSSGSARQLGVTRPCRRRDGFSDLPLVVTAECPVDVPGHRPQQLVVLSTDTPHLRRPVHATGVTTAMRLGEHAGLWPSTGPTHRGEARQRRAGPPTWGRWVALWFLTMNARRVNRHHLSHPNTVQLNTSQGVMHFPPLRAGGFIAKRPAGRTHWSTIRWPGKPWH